MIAAILAWFALRHERGHARRQAIRHLATVAHAIYTGSTSGYRLVPDLPREEDSTEVTLRLVKGIEGPYMAWGRDDDVS